MTDAECAETLSEFRKLTLGPDLSAALDHAIGRLRPDEYEYTFGLPVEHIEPVRPAYPLTGSRAIDLAMA